MTTAQTGGNVSQSITITTEQLQQMIQTATDHALAAVLQAAGGQVVDNPAPEPEPLPEPEPAEDPRWSAVMKKLNKASRPLRWVTISGNKNDHRIFVNMGHTDRTGQLEKYKLTTWAYSWRVDLGGDQSEIDRAVKQAIGMGTRINAHIEELIQRLGVQQSGPNLFAQSSSNGNGGRHD